MTEIIVYSDPLEAWMWTHPEISVPLAVAIIGLILYNENKIIRKRREIDRNNQRRRR